MWPDFSKDHLREVFAEFGKRERRFGLTSAQVTPHSDNPRRTFDPADSVSPENPGNA